MSIYGVTDITHVMQQNLYQERWHLQSIEIGFHQRLSTARSFEGPCSCTCRIMRKTMENPKIEPSPIRLYEIGYTAMTGMMYNDFQMVRYRGGLSHYGCPIIHWQPAIWWAMSSCLPIESSNCDTMKKNISIYLMVPFFENCNFPVIF